MADFYQTGMVATLHRLKQNGTARLEKGLNEISRRRGIALVLPALYREFESPAMRRIAEELAQVNYLRRIVVALGGAGAVGIRKGPGIFHKFPLPRQHIVDKQRTGAGAPADAGGQGPLGRHGRQGAQLLDGLRLHPGARATATSSPCTTAIS